jgi:hypothetical protein
VLCFNRPRETDNNPKRKEANPMKKLEKLVEEFYESFSHREG